ncbi:autotransporter domain-containing protein [Prosthecobacter sp. SYSU 5D2]|uniref:autotransporter domain-containing protein n=1 Tax=Prosthecobacter sp. SYSU 5D2 TaxID=3134134 RepID=UPI0031FF0BD3
MKLIIHKPSRPGFGSRFSAANFKGLFKQACGSLCLLAGGFAFFAPAAHGQSLGAAADFAVLGGSTVTNTGPTLITGDLGVSPGSAITGFPPGSLTGTLYTGSDGPAVAAHADTVTAYNLIAGQLIYTDLTGSDLGGMTLSPGVYHFDTSAQLTGILTLDPGGLANQTFHFLIGSTLTTADFSAVDFLGLGLSPNVFWQIGTSATLGIGTDFYGNILADQSITLATGAGISNGRALAINGAVTLDSAIVNNGAAAALDPVTGTYWKGDVGPGGNLWSGTNWSPDTTGAVNANLAAAGANVIFSVTGVVPVNQDTLLDKNQEIASLIINDNVAVSISGPNTLTINGAGLITGIRVNDGAGLLTIASNLTLAGTSQTITVNNDDGMLVSGVIGGGIGLTKAGTGLLTLTGENIYTGPTNVSAGTLQLGNGLTGSILATSPVSVDLGATLLINLVNGGILSNQVANTGTVEWIAAGVNTQASTSVISGAGALEQSGTGTTVLLGTNTYTGTTLVSDGILQIGDGTSGSINALSNVTIDAGAELHLSLIDGGNWANDVVNNGELHWIAPGSNSQASTSVISGTGSMLVISPGTTVFEGTNTFSGGSIINTTGIVLAGNPSAISGTPYGTGTLDIQQGYVDTLNGQVLQINVGGYTQSGGEIGLHLQGTTPGSYTQYNTGGIATLTGGTVFLYNTSGNYVPNGARAGTSAGDMQTIVQTVGGRTGEFASNLPEAQFYNAQFDRVINYAQGQTLLYPTITYDANNAYVTWVRDSYTSPPGLTPNQDSVGEGLDGYQAVNPGDLDGALTYLNAQPLASLPGLYDLIAPDELTAIFQMGFHAAEIQASRIQQHLEQVRFGARRAGGEVDAQDQSIASATGGKGVVDTAPEAAPASQEGRWNLFVEGLGGGANVNGTSNASGYDFNMIGAMMGADYLVNENFAIGITGGYADSDASLINGGSIDTESYRGAVYATVFGGGFYLDGLLGLAYNEYDTEREALLGRAKGSTNGLEMSALLNGGYNIRSGNWSYGPVASLAYTRVSLDSFTESGSLTPLRYPDQHQESLRSNLGARISYTTLVGGVRVTPMARITWQHEFMDSTQSMDSSFASGPGPVFSVDGPEIGRDSALITAGFNVQFTPSVSAYTFYSGQVGRENYSSHNVTLGMRISF